MQTVTTEASASDFNIRGWLLIALTGAVDAIRDFAGSRPQAEALRTAGVLLGLVVGGLLFIHAISYAAVLPLAVAVLVTLGAMALTRDQRETGRLVAR